MPATLAIQTEAALPCPSVGVGATPVAQVRRHPAPFCSGCRGAGRIFTAEQHNLAVAENGERIYRGPR
jgi:hypothetical protein